MKKFSWNIVSGVYDKTFSKSLKKDIPVILALGKFKPGDAVLDYGGGTGRVAEAIRGLTARVVVADVSEKMLRKAQAKGLATERVESLPTSFTSGSFDAIFVAEALHHMPDHEGHLKEFYRLLKHHGILILEEPDTNSWARHFLWVEKLFDTVRYHRTEEWRAFLERFGFTVEEERRQGFAYFVRARKG